VFQECYEYTYSVFMREETMLYNSSRIKNFLTNNYIVCKYLLQLFLHHLMSVSLAVNIWQHLDQTKDQNSFISKLAVRGPVFLGFVITEFQTLQI
jgi:hypothetical protein